MKNLYLTLIILISIIACHKKSDSNVTPQSPSGSSQYPLDTTAMQNVWWVRTEASGSQTFIYKYYFNSNRTYLQENIFEDSQYATSDTSRGAGVYYFGRGGANNNVISIYLKDDSSTINYYAPFIITLPNPQNLDIGYDVYIKQ